jgi:hypothetical protein
MSFPLSYLRILPQQILRLRKYVYAILAFNTCNWAFFQFSNIFYCRPISMVWEGWHGEHDGECWDINSLILSAAGVTVFLDGIIIALPIRQLLRLSLGWKKRLEVVAMFVVGILYVVLRVRHRGTSSH